MSGDRQIAVERTQRRRRAAREERASVAVEFATIWFARTIGTQEAPWLVRAPNGDTYRAEQVLFSGPTRTRLLSDEERELLPDKPRGVVDATVARLYGATRLP